MCDEPFLIGERLQLTDEEMAAIGPNANRTLHYCSGCMRVMCNRQQGANILAGVFERKLRAAGVPGADRIAERFKQNLLKAATRNLQ